MKRIVFAAAVWLFGCAAALAQQTGPIYCNRSVSFSAVSAATTLVTHQQNQNIYVCGYTLFANAAAVPSLVSGTATNCASTQVVLAGAFTMTIGTQIVDGASPWRGMIALPGQDLCVLTAASTSGVVYYAQQ